MKKLLAVLLSIVMLVTLFVMPVSADTTGTGMLTYSMTESEFRTFAYDNGFSSQMTMNLQSNGSANSKDYYYNVLQKEYSNTFSFDVYNQAVKELDNFTSGKWEVTIDTDILNGAYFDNSPGTVLHQVAQIINSQSIVGMWCYRLDNILETDRFTNVVEANIYCSYNKVTKIISQAKIVVSCVDHPYYNKRETAQRDNIINAIVNTANSKQNQYEALKYIHDTLALLAEYDYDALTAKSYEQDYYYAHSMLGVLINRKGVCESYAKAFKEICDRLSFNTQVAVLTSETHMWNIVKLNGKWYCVDVTWDDFGGDNVDYTYFLCGDPDVVDGNYYDHIPDGQYTIPPVYADDYYTEADILFGWQKIDGVWYFFEDNGEVAADKWIKDSIGWCYVGADGKMATNKWIKDSAGWCYVGAAGYCITNTWMKDSIGWCYLDTNGRMATNKWVKDSAGWCYVGASGYYVTNTWKKDSKGWCYLDANGRMATNKWIKDSQGWCYVGANGYCVTNAWMKDSIGWCYLDANGRMVTNKWVLDSRGWCYIGANGYCVN